MRLPRARLTVLRMMAAVAVVAMALFGFDVLRVNGLANRYRRISAEAARREQRCRQIDAMEPAARSRESESAWDEEYVYLTNPAENRRAIRYFANLRIRYEYAAEHPREPVPPDPPSP